MADTRIQVYGTSWCPDPARARQCLNRLRVPYSFCDIEKDKEGCAFVEKVNAGKRCVPTIVYPDGTILIEPSTNRLEQKLGETH